MRRRIGLDCGVNWRVGESSEVISVLIWSRLRAWREVERRIRRAMRSMGVRGWFFCVWGKEGGEENGEDAAKEGKEKGGVVAGGEGLVEPGDDGCVRSELFCNGGGIGEE